MALQSLYISVGLLDFMNLISWHFSSYYCTKYLLYNYSAFFNKLQTAKKKKKYIYKFCY